MHSPVADLSETLLARSEMDRVEPLFRAILRALLPITRRAIQADPVVDGVTTPTRVSILKTT